ncbi:MAG: hypothetical protein AAFN92_17060, partial [Bacteroidota bacterium]
MTYNYLLPLSLLLFLTTCSPATDPNSAENVPWAEATFLKPALTKLTFTNGDTLPRNLDVDLRRYRENLDRAAPDSLAPGASYTATVAIHRPRYFFYRSGEHESLRPLLPGRNRHLTLSAGKVTESGPYATEYDYLDAVLIPLNPVGRRPSPPESLLTHVEESLLGAIQHRDTVPVPEGLPEYVAPFLDRSLRVGAYYETFTLRSYLKFFYADTLAVPTALRDSVHQLLQKPGNYQTLNYTDLFEALAMLEGEPAANPDYSISTNNRTAIARAYLTGFPTPERAHDAVATHLAKDLTDSRVFLNKMELIDTLKTLLPDSYLAALASIEETALARATSPDGLTNFLTTSWLTPTGDEMAPGLRSERPLRLLKFWFAGCYPCLVQQPHERELLAAYPDVELIYVVHSTKEDQWLTYLEKHTPPAARHFFVKKTDSVLAAAGTTGAPTYVMIDAAGEIICRPCAKP